MGPTTPAVIGWGDARCWCGRNAEQVSLAIVAATADEPARPVVLSPCARHWATGEGRAPEGSMVAVLDLRDPDGPREDTSDPLSAVRWRDLGSAVLVVGTAAALINQAILVTDADGRCLLANAAWSGVTGLGATRSRGFGWMSALGLTDRQRLRRQLSSALPALTVRVQLLEPARIGPPPPVEMSVRTIDAFDGSVLGYLFSFDTAPRSNEPAETAEVSGGLDIATGLPDRAHFVAGVAQALGAVRDQAPTVAVVVVDLEYPDRLAAERAARDPMSVSLALRLARSVRPGDLLARVALDQFAVLCVGVTSFGEVIGVAERLLATTTELVEPTEGGAWSTASVGVAFPHLPEETAERLLVKAERAAALARSNGGDRVEVTIGTGPGSSGQGPVGPAPADGPDDALVDLPVDVPVPPDLDLTEPSPAGVGDDAAALTLQEHLSTASAPLQDLSPH